MNSMAEMYVDERAVRKAYIIIINKDNARIIRRRYQQ